MSHKFKPGDIVAQNNSQNVFSAYSVYLVVSTHGEEDGYITSVPLFRPDIHSFIALSYVRKTPRRIPFESISLYPRHSISPAFLQQLLDREFRQQNHIETETMHSYVVARLFHVASIDQFIPHGKMIQDFVVPLQYKNISDAEIAMLQDLLLNNVLYKILFPPQMPSLPITTL